MKIAIVDDEKKCRTELKEILNNYEQSNSFEIEEFESGSNLFNYSVKLFIQLI